MTPRVIVEIALEQGLDVIAICDHNSARNTAATTRAARRTALTVISGMEITTSEEVHILGLFPSHDAATAVQDEVYARLYGQNQDEVFGYQVVVDEHDQVEDLDQRLLIGATTLSCERAVHLVHEHGGLAIASHIDRQGFGIFTQLGFIPATLKLDALEVSKRIDFDTACARYPQCRDWTLITSSDAHRPDEIGSAFTRMRMAKPTFEELKKALAGEDGRGVIEGLTR